MEGQMFAESAVTGTELARLHRLLNKNDAWSDEE